jgi:hypothetical protein
VLVAGRIVVQEGKVIGLDVDALLDEAGAMLSSIRERNGALQAAVKALSRNPR